MPQRIRSFDWSATPLGPIDQWPRSLSVAVGICLASRFPMFVWWGPELINIYNDSYVPFLGKRHPAALGRPARDSWNDIWQTVGPQADAVMQRGEATWNDRVLLVMERNGYSENTYFTWSYSPIPDDAGGIGGLFCACTEETERVRAEAERDQLLNQLAAERSRLVEVIKRSPSFMTILRGPQHVFELANDRYYELVGPRKLIGLAAREAVPEAEGQGFFELLDRVYATGEPFIGKEMSIGLRREPGAPMEDRILEFVYQPMRDPDGSVSEIFCHGLDLTERKRAEAALRESEERFRAAFDQTAVGMVLTDRDGVVLRVNEAFCDIVGHPPEELIGRDSTGYTYPDDRPRNVERIRQAHEDAEGSAFYEKRFVRGDGSVVWAQVSLSAIGAGGPGAGLIAAIEDITDRKENEERLARDATLLANVQDSVIVTDLEGTVTFWNEGATRLFGWASQEMLGRPYADRLPEPSRGEVRQWIFRIAAGETEFQGEWLDYRKDGSRVWIESTTRLVRDTVGRPLGIMGVARDASDRKRAEAEREQLLASERAARAEAERASRMKDEFLATLSHELRTPLNAILGWSQILAEGGADAKDLEEGLRTIERNARAQTQIIEDLLDMSRIISGKVRLDVRQVDLASVVQSAVETVKPAAEAKGVRLRAVLDPLAAPISGDPNRLQQVFWNLLSNAIKFTPRDGHVHVVLERVNSHIEVSVTDTGEGIAPEFLPHVFDRFRQADASTTRRHGGLGLGLAIARQLAELHGGSIRVKSMGSGKGSTFIVSLPLAPVHGRPEPDPERNHPKGIWGLPSPQARVRLAGLRVLVVDDEPDARNLVKRLLEDCEAKVAVAGSAPEAIEQLSADPPDVLVSDIGMPGEDGYALIQRVRSLPGRGGATPAVALTAYARAEDRVKAILAGYQHHITKPVEPAELIAVIASLAGRTGKPG